MQRKPSGQDEQRLEHPDAYKHARLSLQQVPAGEKVISSLEESRTRQNNTNEADTIYDFQPLYHGVQVKVPHSWPWVEPFSAFGSFETTSFSASRAGSEMLIEGCGVGEIVLSRRLSNLSASIDV